jgi:RimJ/RimL family protein N-acetyltransferase
MIDFGFGVKLGTVQRSELPQLLEWRNDRRVWKWCRQNDLITPPQHEQWFETMSRDAAIRMYTIWDEKIQKVVGVCGLTSIDTLNQRAEFSCYIGPKHQRRAYASKALKTLFSHGFHNLNLNGIWGETYEGNPAGKLFESIGMEREGVRKEFYFRDGVFIDAILYSVLRRNWKY